MDRFRSSVNGPQIAQSTDHNRSMERNVREVLIRNLKLLRAHQVAIGRLPPDHSDHPCPATGRKTGACPGYVVDHIHPLKRGGADHPDNMQWQTRQEAREKDRWE